MRFYSVRAGVAGLAPLASGGPLASVMFYMVKSLDLRINTLFSAKYTIRVNLTKLF